MIPTMGFKVGGAASAEDTGSRRRRRRLFYVWKLLHLVHVDEDAVGEPKMGGVYGV